MKYLFLILSLLLGTFVFASDPCPLGESLEDLQSNREYQIQWDLLKTFKIDRSSFNAGLILVSVSVMKNKSTGKVYHLNATFMDKYDGGNTTGWIEDYTDAENDGADNKDLGKVVCHITDSDLIAP